MTARDRPISPLSAGGSALAIAIVLLMAEGASLEAVSQRPLIEVGVDWTPSGAGLSADFHLTAGAPGLSARASLLPGGLGASSSGRSLLWFADPAYPYPDGTESDASFDAPLIGSYLQELGRGPSAEVAITDDRAMPQALASHPGGILLMINAVAIPSDLLGPNVSLLEQWIRAGGTLVWTGGPIAEIEGHQAPNGTFATDQTGPAGQRELLGFDLTAAPSAGPFLLDRSIGNASPMAEALGLQYEFDAYGPEVSALDGHGGRSLGFEGPAAAPGGPLVTSIGWLPMGTGEILDFGGGSIAPGVSVIPQANQRITQDIAELLALGYEPSALPPSTASIDLPWPGSLTVPLHLANRSGGVVAYVRTGELGVDMEQWSEPLGGGSTLLDAVDHRSHEVGEISRIGVRPAS